MLFTRFFSASLCFCGECLRQTAAQSAPSAAPSADSITLKQCFAVLAPEQEDAHRLYPAFYSYVISPHAVVEKGKVFCAFQNSKGRPVVMAYDIGRKNWEGPVRASEAGLRNDAHGNPAICVDGEGCLHVFYGCHGGPMRHTRSARPYDIGAWAEQPPPAPRATYPQIIRQADSALCLFYRAGGHVEPWSLRISRDNGRTWSEAERVIEMRLDPRDPLAAAYCDFFPGSDGRTIHCVWNHKDDNAARVTPDRPHPWRPLKYPGLHEAVYRYNIYYVRRDPDGVWRNAAGEAMATPISKASADAKCLVYDSGDEFASPGALAVDRQNRMHIRFRVGVTDWTKGYDNPKAVLVPLRTKYARFESDRWRISDAMPADWPEDVPAALSAPGEPAYGDLQWGRWFIGCTRRALAPNTGSAVFLYHDKSGFALRPDGPAFVE